MVLQNKDSGGLKSNARSLMVSAELTKVEGDTSMAKASEPEKAADDAKSEQSDRAPAPVDDQAERVLFQEVVRMRVVSYHEQLEKVYYFEFWDDVENFKDSSAVFNRVLASTRFLD